MRYTDGTLLVKRIINIMQRTRTEVGRWRMLRQAQRRRNRWLEGQSRRNSRIQHIRTDRQLGRHKRSLLYATKYEWWK